VTEIEIQHEDRVVKGKVTHSQHRAQALVEFVLALPVLVLLLFGIIEIGRLLQTWLAVQNAARFGVRYAVTGDYNRDYCGMAASALGYEDEDQFGGNAIDCMVPREYCDSLPEDEQDACDYQQMTSELQDWARLPSIADISRSGGAGTSVDDREVVSGDYLEYLFTHNLTNLGAPFDRGYFHVTVCSSRDGDGTEGYDFLRVEYTDPDTCLKVNESPNIYMDDAGGPGDRVRVTVRYVHPMIMPLISSVWPTVPLTAWREGIVEQFRVARIGGLGGDIGLAPTPTATATTTLTPSLTPIPPTYTNTPVPPSPTNTPIPPTHTPTPTPTGTPPPLCSDLRLNGPLTFSDDDLLLSMSNLSTIWPVTITRVVGIWAEQEGMTPGPWHDQVNPPPANQFFDSYLWGANVVLDANPNISLVSPPVNWGHNLSFNIIPLQTNNLDLDFNLSFPFPGATYYHARDFTVTLSYSVGGLACPDVSATGRFGPRVSIDPPLPDTVTEPFNIRASASDPDGTINQVRFEIWNSSETTILGFRDDPAAPYCLFVDASGNCVDRGLGYVWPNSNNPILNGEYVVYVQARDNDSPSQYTRIRQEFTLNLPPLVACNNLGNGLRGDYLGWVGNSPPNLNNAPLLYSRIDSQVNFNWGQGAPAPGVPSDHFAVRWSGSLQPRYNQADVYTIYFRSDDGVRLWVNGQLIIDHWNEQPSTEWSGTVNTVAGCPLYAITIEYFDHTSDALAQLRWESPSVIKEVIPQANLYPPAGGLPPTSTASPMPTATNTPIPTSTRTNTPTATRTATATEYIPPTSSATATATSEVTPTATQPLATTTNTPPPSTTPTRTVTPTPCLTPPDLGGCR
jgi:hypothetical protein